MPEPRAVAVSAIKPHPCPSCPYRLDVPSGIWAHSEYEKLRTYDAPTGDQPIAVFACHASPDELCHGWAVCHMSRGHEYDLLALRWHGSPPIPDAAVPLFSSGNDAADWGQQDIDEPSPEAEAVMARLLRHYPRLRTQPPEGTP